jgi:hypothetical protein
VGIPTRRLEGNLYTIKPLLLKHCQTYPLQGLCARTRFRVYFLLRIDGSKSRGKCHHPPRDRCSVPTTVVPLFGSPSRPLLLFSVPSVAPRHFISDFLLHRSICESTVGLFALKQIGAHLAWLVSEVTRPCWLAVTFGLLAAALLVYSTTWSRHKSKKWMFIKTSTPWMSMIHHSIPITRGSNAFRFQVRSLMGSGRSVTCECELPSPLPRLQRTNFKTTVMAKASPDLCCKSGAKALPSRIPEI